MNGSPGDFDRCRAFMRRHDVPGYEIDGACANLHKLATGEWPGRNAHKSHLATAAVISLTAAMGTYDPIRWEGPLARIESPTGDRRQFPRDTLTYQSFPQPYRWQKQGMGGHTGAVTVGVIEAAAEKDVDEKLATQYNITPGRYVWGNGYFLDPTVIPEVNEAVHQVEHGVSGPSVDLDSFTAVLSKNLAGETVANMKRGRMRAATLVSVPAFADLRIKVTRPKALVASITEFAVNPAGWRDAPIAPREALFDADDAAKRIEAWANGDPDKMAKMFLWINTENGPLLGRQGYRLPWGDIVDEKPYLIFHAVYAAAALLQDAHGGLPNIPDEEKGKLRSIITEIYQELAQEYDDPSIMAPWDRQAQAQQASGEPEDNDWFEGTGEYADYMYAHTAALQEFVRRHRYTEWKHPRDKRKNKHAGEWRDVPKHDAHGRIKVGSKWVYPPKKGEKGYRNPESAVKGIAKRGGGAKRGPSTHVVKKAKPSPDKGSSHRKAPEPSHPAAPDRRGREIKGTKATDKERQLHEEKQARRGDKEDIDKKVRRQVDLLEEHRQANLNKHVANLKKAESRQNQKHYLGQLDDDTIDDLVKKLGGTKHDDDKRDDLETEILHQLGKDDEKDITEEERRKDQEKARKLREISHDGGKKTIIARKQQQEKKEPEKTETTVSDRLSLRMVRDDGEEGHPYSKHPIGGSIGKVLADLESRGLVERRKHGRADHWHITDKGHEALKGHEDEEPAKKTEVQKELEKKPVKKTTVAKKTGEAKEHKLTPAQDRAMETLRKDDGAKIHPATRKVLEREGYIDSEGKLTIKGREHLGVKGPEKAPEKKAEPEKKTTVVKKTPVAQDDKLSDAQQRALEAISKNKEGTHQVGLRRPTRDILERKGYVEKIPGSEHERDKGLYMVRLTQKGKDHLGIKEEKAPEKKTTVAKKTPDKEQAARDRQERLDAGANIGGLAAEVEQLFDSDVDGRVMVRRISSYQIRMHGKPGSDKVDALANKIATGRSNEERLRLAREGLAEHGVKLTGAAGAEETFDPAKHESIGGAITKGHKVTIVRPGYTVHEGGTDVQVAKAKVEAVSGKDAARRVAIAEHVAFLKNTDDADAALKRVENLQKKDLMEIAEKLGVEELDARYDTANGLRTAIVNQVHAQISHNTRQRRAAGRKTVLDLRAEQKTALDRLRKGAKPQDTGYNPDVLRNPPSFDPMGYQSLNWWTGMRQDTGPEGVPVRDLTVALGSDHFDFKPYTIKKGTVYRIDGISYLVEDGAGTHGSRVTAQQLHKFHESLPPSASKSQKAYVVLKGTNPADPYWQKRFNNKDHKAIATAGDGSTRIWQGGFYRGEYPTDEEELFAHLQHEFGHNAGKSPDARDQNIHDDSVDWLRAAEADSSVETRKKIPKGIEWIIPQGSFHPETTSAPPSANREFPHGVSKYGKSSQHEDYAESTFQYLTGPIGIVHRDGKAVPVYFRDVFPRRAHLLDLLYPDVAKIQKEQVRKRGEIPS